jgi:long-chain acyl-CoA synthetase
VSLAQLLDEGAARNAKKTAFVESGTPTSYDALAAGAASFAATLQERGVRAGDRIALLLPNSDAFVAAYYGSLRIGAVVVPLNILLSRNEIETRLESADVRILVTDRERAGTVGEARAEIVELEPSHAIVEGEAEAELVACADNDTAVILYTSGTTGGPKGALLTHGGLRANADACREAFELTDADVLLGSAPFSHVFGMTFLMNAALLSGSTVVLAARFEPAAALAAMVEHGVTVFGGVPTMFAALVAAAADAHDLPPLRIAHSGGAPLPLDTLRAFEERFRCPVLEGYGLTEISGVATTHRVGRPQKPGSAGTPVPGTELRIVSLDGDAVPEGERGEVQLRGASVIREYRIGSRVVAATDDDGWLSNGDVGFVDEDGYLFLVDRKKDLIIRGGYNVYPREVEEVLYEHPDVFEAAVVGVPDETYGEEVVAVVVAQPGHECEPDDVKAFVRERVAAYKYPRHVVVVDELPKGPSGKIIKREIDRDELARAFTQPIR